MTRFGTMWRRGFVFGASVALMAAAIPAVTVAQEEPVEILTHFSSDLGDKALGRDHGGVRHRDGRRAQHRRDRP